MDWVKIKGARRLSITAVMCGQMAVCREYVIPGYIRYVGLSLEGRPVGRRDGGETWELLRPVEGTEA